MTEFEGSTFDPRLEAYLDGVMDSQERVQFDIQVEHHSELAAEIALDARLNAALLRQFPLVQIPTAHLIALERNLAATNATLPTTPSVVPWPWVAAVAAAAAACVALLVWSPEVDSQREPAFAPTPLANIYQATVNAGFEPYYECHDEERFADTFSRRQGIPLVLAKLPPGRIMKGLSYPGGLSRETTAMLCEVDGHPVIVFVDRDEKDLMLAAQESDPNLNVFREQRDGLVFYEVTPLDKPNMIQFMVPAKNANGLVR